MTDLTLTGASSTPAVRRPVLEVSFGNDSADDWAQAIVSMSVETGLAPMVNAAEIILSADTQTPDVAIDDTGSVSLGYEDGSAELVFTGQIESVRHSVHGTTHITAVDGGAMLSKLRVNQSYEQQKAGDIVSDLAGRAEVGTDTIEDGVDFPFYVIDDRRSAYQHIAALAKKSGFLAYFMPDGNLNFAPFVAGQAVQTFTYGEDILSLQLTESSPVVGAVTTIGEGAAGSQGQEAWSWLVKNPSSVTGNAGDGDPERQIQDASLRSSNAAQSAADGISSAAVLTQLAGRILVPGASAVVVGSAIEISDAPQDELNGLCLVRRVQHRYSKDAGFTTLVVFSQTGNGGMGGLP